MAKGKQKKSVKQGSGGKRSESGLLALPKTITGPRLAFIASLVVLCVIGLVMVYSSSSITAYNDYGDSTYFFKRQLIFLAVGVLACIFAAKLPYGFWSSPAISWIFWGVCAVAMLAMSVVGNTTLGATRSITVAGFDVQPTEFAKASLIILEASLINRYYKGDLEMLRMVGESVAVIAVTIVLIYIQPDLGTEMILLVGLVVLVWVAGIPARWIVGIFGVLIALFAISCITQPYHLQRLMVAFNPWIDADDTGYQSVQGLLALGSGGPFGTGLGMSRQKYLYLPYAYNDFIYAIIGEELGLVGAAFVLLLFGCLVFSGILIARSAPDMFGCAVASGLTAMIGFQACLNMMMVVGLAPVTGKALPFISYGGSSLLASLFIAGIVISISLNSSPDAPYEMRRDDLLIIEGGRSKERSGKKKGSRSKKQQQKQLPAASQQRSSRQKSRSQSSSQRSNSSRSSASSSRSSASSSRSSQRSSSGGRLSYSAARGKERTDSRRNNKRNR